MHAKPADSRTGVLFRAAAHTPAADSLLQHIETLLQLNGADVLRYADKNRGQRRTMRLQRNTVNATLEGFLLAGDTSAQKWITALLQDEQPAQNYGRALLAPGSKPPVPVVSQGKAVCACFNVTDVAITSHLAQCHGSPTARLAGLQGALKCGTNCGSCIPQLQRMVRACTEPGSTAV
jgi:assimilatory nitrate reductase catalytic subunit